MIAFDFYLLILKLEKWVDTLKTVDNVETPETVDGVETPETVCENGINIPNECLLAHYNNIINEY